MLGLGGFDDFVRYLVFSKLKVIESYVNLICNRDTRHYVMNFNISCAGQIRAADRRTNLSKLKQIKIYGFTTAIFYFFRIIIIVITGLS